MMDRIARNLRDGWQEGARREGARREQSAEELTELHRIEREADRLRRRLVLRRGKTAEPADDWHH